MLKHYDRLCEGCGWVAIDVLEPADAGTVACPSCDGPTVRAWLTKSSNVIGDEMDHVQVNGLKEPRRFRSKLEHKRWLKDSGWSVNESHPEAGGALWLEKAEALAQRHGGMGTKDAAEEPMHVNWTSGDVTPAMLEEYRGKR